MAKGITRSKSVLVAAGGVAAGTGAFADQIDTVAGAFSATQSAVGSAVGLQATIAALLDGPAVPWFLLAMTICGTLGLFALGPAILIPVFARRRKRWRTGRCEVCGYDLSASRGADRCPECGTGWKT